MGYRIYLGGQRYYAGLDKCLATGRMTAAFMPADCWTLPRVPVLVRAAAVERLHQLRRAGVSAWLVPAL